MNKTITMLVAFDGTGNHKKNDEKIKDDSQTNVAELVNRYNLPIGHKFYEEGVGTVELTYQEIKIITEGKAKKEDYYDSKDMAFGLSVKDKVISMLGKIEEPIKDALKAGETIKIDVTGFSRGAASARDFVNEFNKRYSQEIQSGKISINNVILFDTVATIYLANSYNEGLNLNLSENSAKNIIQFTAKDEKRENFPLESLKDINGNLPSNTKEFILFGVHSNIGAGYKKVVVENTIVKSEFISYLSENELALKKAQLLNEGEKLGLSVEFKEYSTTHKGIQYTQHKYNFIDTKIISNELSSVSLQLAIDELVKSGANINNTSTLNKQIPNELIPYYNAIKNGQDITPYEAIVQKYIHNSAHDKTEMFSNPKDKFIDWLSNRDSDGKRDTYLNEPSKAVNPENPLSFNNEDNLKKDFIEYVKENYSINIAGVYHIDNNSIKAIEDIKDYLIEKFNANSLSDLNKDSIEEKINTSKEVNTNKTTINQEKEFNEKIDNFSDFTKVFMENTEPKESIEKIQKEIENIKHKETFDEKINKLENMNFKDFTSNTYIEHQLLNYRDKIVEESTISKESINNTFEPMSYYFEQNSSTQNKSSIQMME